MINLCRNPVARICAQMLLDFDSIHADQDIVISDASDPQFQGQLNLCVDVQHVTNNKIAGWHKVPWIDRNIKIIVECEDPNRHHSNILFYDFLWNRSKAYYTQRAWDYRPWYLYYNDNFLLQDTSTADEKTRLFLSPSKPSTDFRSQLADLAQQFNGYANTVLESNFVNPDATTVSSIGSVPKPPRGYSPVHNAYYRETFFSVYTETVEKGTTLAVTEKTLDPLIKGHFILPFSACGFVKYLRQQGWRLPDFIDYSYDSIADDQLRFQAFANEFRRLCSLDMDKWRQHWVDNLSIINYNRSQLYHRPYHHLALEQL